MTTILVGVDGSSSAQRALEWALTEAKLRKAKLRVIGAWEVPVSMYTEGAVFLLPAPEFEKGTTDMLTTAVDEAVAKLGAGDVVIEPLTINGRPSQILLDQAKDAEMIVVGNRGRGGFTSLLLGSVSSQVVHHASCPVVVVPSPED